MSVGNTSDRSKQKRRDRAWLYLGNAQVADQMLQPVGREALTHPNRVLFQFRSSNKGRRVA